MDKFLKTLFIFLVPVLIFLIGMEIFLRSIPNEYKYKKEYLDKNHDSINILILGSSHTQTALNPYIMPKNTFNLSQGARSVDIDVAIFNKYKSKLKNLKVLILDISSFTFYDQLKNETKPYGSRMLEYNVVYKFNKLDIFNYGTLVLNKDILETIHKNYTQPSYIPDSLGWDPRKAFLSKSEIIKTGIRRAQKHNNFNNSEFAEENFKENYQYIKEVVDWCEDNNVTLIFITTPTHFSYYERLDRQKLNRTIVAVNSFINNGKNIYYYDYSKDNTFHVEDFYDADHLSEKGASKFTQMVSDSINRIYLEKQFR